MDLLNVTPYINKVGNDCEFLAKDALKDLFGNVKYNLLYCSSAIVILSFIYLGIEYYKVSRISKITKEGGDIQKAFKLNNLLGLIQRFIVFFNIIIGARLLQLAFWSL